MKKIMILTLGSGALLFTACDRTHTGTTGTDPMVGGENTTMNESATTASGGMYGTDQDAVFRDRSSRTSAQMATDLQLDDQTRTRADEIYYNRAQRRAEAQQQYSADTEGLNREMQNIDAETDRQFQSILTQDQYQRYEQNRDNYADRDNYELNQSGTNRSGGMGTDMNNHHMQQGTQHGQHPDGQPIGTGTQTQGTDARSGHPMTSPNTRPQYESYSGSDGTTPSTSRDADAGTTSGTNRR